MATEKQLALDIGQTITVDGTACIIVAWGNGMFVCKPTDKDVKLVNAASARMLAQVAARNEERVFHE